MKFKLTLILLCLLIVSHAQTDCAQSRIAQLQTGQIQLNPNDLGTAGASKNYYESLASAQFNAGDLLGHAFAIAGFQGSCSQTYFSLVVDVVEFQNQNTKMRIVIDFRNANNTGLTVWSKVKLSYLVVSSTRYDKNANLATPYTNTGFVWATNTEVDLSSGDKNGVEVFKDSIFGLNDQTGCGLTYDATSTYKFGLQCGTAPNFDNDVAVHVYIMGFKYAPDANTTRKLLAVSVQWNAWMNADSNKQVAKFGTSRSTADYGLVITYIDSTSTVNNGPVFKISSYDKELQKVKIALVMTLINPVTGDNKNNNGYNTGSSFSYSGLYTSVLKANYNVKKLVDKTKFNQLYEKLPSRKYIIYGLSQFQLLDGSNCSSLSIDVNIDTPSTYTVSMNNVDYMTNIIFQADIFTPATKSFCNPSVQFSTLNTDYTILTTDQDTIALKTARNNAYPNLKYIQSRNMQQYSTVPSNNVDQNVLQITDNPLDLKFSVNSIKDDKTNVQLNAKVIMNSIISGKPYGIKIRFVPKSSSTSTTNPFHDATDGTLYQFLIKINGITLFNQNYKASQLKDMQASVTSNNNNFRIQRFLGNNLVGTTATFEYILVVPRSPTVGQDYKFQTYVDLFEFQQVYDPVTQCCVSSCPSKTGLDVSVTPVSCVVCDQSKGLQYNPTTATCECKSGFYMNANLQFQCFPCTASMCSSCNSTRPDQCLACVNGGLLNDMTATCSCTTGYYQVNNTCANCPAKCGSCSISSTCDTCSDSNRDINRNCSCIVGFYDSGVDKCQTCNPVCATCSNINNCTTCDSRKNRVLKGSLCVCQDRFYELVYQNGTRQCKACSIECGTCSISPNDCLTCNSAFNRVEGYDSLGRRTCICKPGFRALTDGSCIQSDCKADKYCSQCDTDLSVCTQCRSSLNRVIKLPEYICICNNGFYEDINGTCQPCGSGCSKCTSATNCLSCVIQSTPNNNGNCTCAAGTFFTITNAGVRYCKECIANCNSCNNSLTCNSCKSGFILSTDNTCVCPKRNYINSAGECVPCKAGCEACSNATTCSKCVSPLFVQADNCVVRCTDGFFVSGAVCAPCSSNCSGCTTATTCFYCSNGTYLYGGSCYNQCPSGTVADRNTFNCVPCNSPCKTCANHPSACTSCQPGIGFLQITGTDQTCVKQCADGTYPKNNVCQVCDFKCSKCLGTSTNCISCPTGRFLYNGACWDSCPGVMMNGLCVNSCPSSYYRLSDQQCKPCDLTCETCSSNSSCTTCKNGLFSKSGLCVADCGSGFYSFRGICVACDKSCKSCDVTPTQCTSCNTGFIKFNALCVNSCPNGTYLDTTSNTCKTCSSQCLTCSSQNICTTCVNSLITPYGGQCLSCIFPCDTCSADLQTCNSCVSGYYLSAGQCSRTCPSGSRPVGGICTCSSGLFLNGACVSVCPSGFAKIGSECRRCQTPCNQCAGSTSFCTDCLDTFVLKPSTGECSKTSLCNYGQQELNGKCEQICDDGSYFQNGACIFGGCPDGFKDNGFGGCVLAETSTSRCDSPTFRLNGVCVQNCGNNYFPNANTRMCDTCATNCLSCLNKNYCLACSSSFAAVDGKCLSKSNCLINQFQYGSTCVSSCPLGTFTSNGRCIRSCPVESFYFGNVCYNTCPTQALYYTENSCVAACPSNCVLIGNICNPKI